jgi:hypothetical protein
MSVFNSEHANFIAQDYGTTDEGRLHAYMSLIGPNEAKMIGLLESIQVLPFFSSDFKAWCKSLIKFYKIRGLSKYQLSEFDALCAIIAHSNQENLDLSKLEDNDL